MKKVSGNTIVNIAAAILLLITLIVVEVSFQTAQGWFDESNHTAILILGIAGILLLLAAVVLNMTGIGSGSAGISVLKMLLSVGACVCAGVIFGLVMGAIATEFAYTFFSDFNKGTAKEYFMPTACTQAVTGMVLSVVTIIAAAAANAFTEKKN